MKGKGSITGDIVSLSPGLPRGGLGKSCLDSLAMLARGNKLGLDAGPRPFPDEIETRFRVLPIAAKACARAAALPAPYPNDPADRITSATAIVEDLPLITADRAIVRSGAVHVVC
jgi:PIN domain nuclease of toxin-antitoxin system